MQSSIRTPGSIWAKLIQESSENAKKPDGRSDGVVYFVGPRSSGKSTLLNRFLYPTRIEPPKPSEGLEYTYARKPAAFDHERKDMAHIYEIGGSKEFGEEIARGDQVFLTAKQVTTAVVVIVVDLSDLSAVLPTALYWLDQIKQKLTSTYEKFEKKGLQLPEQMRQRAKSKLYSGNDDKDAVYHSGISIVIVATKYDMFKDKDPEQKKMVCRALRYVAHSHGAFLVSLGGLHTSSEGAGSDAPMERALLDNFTRLMNHLIFVGLEKKPTLKMNPAFDHLGPLMVPAGTDKFRDIGRPQGGMTDANNVASGVLEWRDGCTKMFVPKKEEKSKGPMVIDERYKEEEVDVVRVRKLAELTALRKEAEAYKEATKRKAVLAKAQAAEKGTSSGKPGSSSSIPEKATREKKSSSSSSGGAGEKRSSTGGEKKSSSSAAEVPTVSPEGGAPVVKAKKALSKPKATPTILPSEAGIVA